MNITATEVVSPGNEVAVWIAAGELIVFGVLMLILPHITRRGLLFGAYVGEENTDSSEALRIRRGWYMAMGLSITFSIATWLIGWRILDPALLSGVMWIPLTAGLVISYVWAHKQARRITPAAAAPAAVAFLEDEPAAPLLPLATLLISVGLGVLSVVYVAMHYHEMPDRIPVHFRLDGTPDRWVERSWLAVMILPAFTLILGVCGGIVAIFLGRAKRALRAEREGVSLEAQRRFRRAMTRFICGVILLTTGMMADGAIGTTNFTVEGGETLGGFFNWLALGLLGWCILGTIYLAVRYGQGGARLERPVASAPLANGLADNSKWLMGVIYVNRDDPSVFVEHRFGLGYTVNFGNPRAVALISAFLVLIAGVTVVAIVAS